MSKFVKVIHDNGSIEAIDYFGKTVGIIFGMDSDMLQTWETTIEACVPESFGPVYAEHLLDWAEYMGYYVMRPRPSWITTIQGSVTSEKPDYQ